MQTSKIRRGGWLGWSRSP